MAESAGFVQVSPAAGTETLLYAVTGGYLAVSSITICNQNADPITFRIRMVSQPDDLDVKQYIYYNQTLEGYSTFAATMGLAISSDQECWVWASNVNVSFNLFAVFVDIP